jgi:hypothetical protein
MTKQIKLIWDFKGPNAQKIADHFRIHLDEALIAEEGPNAGVSEINENHAIAFLIVPENEMVAMRDRFKPHRGEYVTL